MLMNWWDRHCGHGCFLEHKVIYDKQEYNKPWKQKANKKHGDYIYLWRRKSTQQNLLLYYRSHDWWLFYQSSIRNSIKNLQDFILNDEGYNHSVSSENKLTLDPRSLLRNDDVLFNKTLPNVEICRRAKCRRAKCRRATHNQYFT